MTGGGRGIWSYFGVSVGGKLDLMIAQVEHLFGLLTVQFSFSVLFLEGSEMFVGLVGMTRVQ